MLLLFDGCSKTQHLTLIKTLARRTCDTSKVKRALNHKSQRVEVRFLLYRTYGTTELKFTLKIQPACNL